MYIYKREAETLLRKMSQAFKVLIVVGPRQVGKSTLLDEIKPKGMTKISLDNEVLREQAQNEPELFLKEHPAPLFIDEAQYAPRLMSYIKIQVDNSEERSLYWLSGSQPYKLNNMASESLAGRAGIVNLNSLTYSEISGIKKELFTPQKIQHKPSIDVNELYQKIFLGGMPELYANPNMSRDMFFRSYIKTYLDKDVKQLSQVGNVVDFERFMRAVALRIGEPVNYSNIARDVNISVPTANAWMSILVESNIVYLMESYSSNFLNRLTHMPKIIFMDTGLASYLASWKSARDLQLSEKSGHYLESYIISDIIKSYNNKGEDLDITFYRNKEKEEIDLLIRQNGILYPFEIKKTANPKREMLKNFKDLKNTKEKIGKGGIICLFDDLISLDEENYIIPISSIIL